ncbi:MAG: radical SAM protein [Deltaproteobacteria bacterium]|nr:radical SAM protein [Deltaproteobacteria bacterium]
MSFPAPGPPDIPQVMTDSRGVSRFLAPEDPLAVLAGVLGRPFLDYRRRWDEAKNFVSVPPFPLHVDYEMLPACNLRCPMCLMAGRDKSADSLDIIGNEAEARAGKKAGEKAGEKTGKKAGGNKGFSAKDGLKTPGGQEEEEKEEKEKGRGGDGSEKDKNNPDLKTLSPAAVKTLLDEGAERGQASMGFGGLWEPLLSPHIASLVAHGRQRGLVEAMFNTNGSLLTADVSRDLISAGLTRIMISLDAATKETYKLMRPGSDLGLVEENVREFLALRDRAGSRLPLVRLSFCLTSLNEREWPAFVERWRGKADFFSLQSYGRFSPDSPALFPRQRPVPVPAGICAQPFKRLLVRHDGRVLPCCDLSGLPLELGGMEDGLETVWRGEKLAALRARIRGPEKGLPRCCRECQGKYEPRED